VTTQTSLGWRAWLAIPAALIVLNASLTFENVWPTPRITWGDSLSLELALAVLVLALACRHAWRVSRILPAIWVVLVAGHYLDVTAPGLYGREFNVYWDGRHLGNVAAMLAAAAPWWLIGVVITSVGLAVWVVYVVARLAVRQLAAAVEYRRIRVALAALAAVVVALNAAQRLPGFPIDVAFADPVTPAYFRQVRFALAMAGPGAAAPSLGPSPRLDTGLRGLDGIDVLLIFVESYGAVTWETPAMSAGLAESRRELDAAIRETGREVVSAYVDSPTFGGSSWLAHLSLLTGVDVRDQYAYTAVMASNRDNLVTNFARRGYRTVALMPGMRQAWPEGAFYGFDVIYGRDHLEYPGPQFGWWGIPDQYALARLDVLERRQSSRKPVFAVFPTSTTHAPFGPVPPYQREWSRVLTADAYDPADVERTLAGNPDLSNLGPSYVRAMAYEYQSLAGYIREQPGDVVLVLIGDHQPPAAVSGRDAPWRVPVHVVGRREAILQRLRDGGFRPGLEPRRPAIGAMYQLTPLLLDAFDAVTPASAASTSTH
jgi:hypothetical protein